MQKGAGEVLRGACPVNVNRNPTMIRPIRNSRLAVAACAFAACAWLALAAFPARLSAQDTSSFAISRIAGDLYRFQNATHRSVFLVTPEGIVVTDPISADVARWLKGELQSRFNLPVKYVIYSHGHGDHISGGEAFADTATFVAHAGVAAQMERSKVTAPAPQETFTDRKTIRLGGKTIELAYLGRNHTDNSIVMLFPEARTVFAVDFVSVKRVHYRDFPDAFLDEWPESLRKLEALDFDILAPGHGVLGTKDDVRTSREYLEDLRAQVAAQLAQGKDEAQIVAAVTMEKYRGWERYEEWRALNVQGMVRHLQSR